MESIAICITTRNRPQVLKKSFEEWTKYLPENATIIVVDDASAYNIPSNFRFNKNVGIARAKSKCLELAQNYDHIFLVDDDVYPKVKDWHLPYINSGENHLCLTFDTNYKGKNYSSSIKKDGEHNGLISYTAPNGCFLYLKKICVEKAGGFRQDFNVWGFEHVEYSTRIHALGLTPKPFLDVPNSLDLIHVLDYYQSVQSSISATVKQRSGKINFEIYKKYAWSKDYVPF